LTDIAKTRLHDAWKQCQKHAHHMSHALAAIEPTLPLTAQALASMTDETVQGWDHPAFCRFVLKDT